MLNVLMLLNRIFNKKQKIQIIGLLLLILISACFELIGVTLIFPYVNIIMDDSIIFNSQALSKIYSFFQMTSTKHMLLFLTGVLISVYIIKNAFLIFMSYIQYTLVYKYQRQMSTRMLKCYINQPYLFHVEKNISELQRNINSDILAFFQVLLEVLKLASELMVCIILGIFLMISDPFITCGILIILSIFTLIFIYKLKPRLRKQGENKRIFDVLTSKWLHQAFGGIKEIKILNIEEFFIQKYDESISEFMAAKRSYDVIITLPKPMMETLCISGILCLTGIKIMSGTDLEVLVPQLTVFVFAAFRLLPSFNRIVNALNIIIYNKACIVSVYSEVKEMDRIESSIKKDVLNTDSLIFNYKIQVRDLSFRYPGMNHNLFTDVNLELLKGDSLALVGPSGAGKTTLADLILGILYPSEGIITVDDMDIQKIQNSWQKEIGYIPQTIYLIDDTIKNNIAFGVNKSDINDDLLWKVARDAKLDKYIESLDKGMDTIVGEQGVKLSGGQRQRIGIARALYREPEILVLDEATSALDNETEEAVMESIDQLQGKVTLLIIAHRLTTIKNCNRIYEVENGKVTQIK